ncbi:MAG: hypothetical protein KJ000_32475 [Pirellulaceae bacterium]|nr:hypothetical protein [Pirellulaceae bacterium]
MSRRVALTVVWLLLAPVLGAASCGQDVRVVARPPIVAGGLRPANVGGDPWTMARRLQWFWYSPQQWQFPGYVAPPVFFPLDSGGLPGDAWYPDPFDQREFDLARPSSEPSRTIRSERREPQAYQWNEATGRAEPVEVQRWGGRRGNGPAGDGL